MDPGIQFGDTVRAGDQNFPGDRFHRIDRVRKIGDGSAAGQKIHGRVRSITEYVVTEEVYRFRGRNGGHEPSQVGRKPGLPVAAVPAFAGEIDEVGPLIEGEKADQDEGGHPGVDGPVPAPIRPDGIHDRIQTDRGQQDRGRKDHQHSVGIRGCGYGEQPDGERSDPEIPVQEEMVDRARPPKRDSQPDEEEHAGEEAEDRNQRAIVIDRRIIDEGKKCMRHSVQ